MTSTAVCLMGPTASGKTDLAIRLCKRFPFDVISVDSALVYRGMDIGTAKPDADTLRDIPHRLIDIRDPETSYSAGEFVRDAHDAMQQIYAAGRIPLLVGGTMMYFRVLTGGIADLPAADSDIRQKIDAEARRIGWPAMHAQLRAVDPAAANRIEPGDSQRIQRALEVYRASGKSLSDWQRSARCEVRIPDVRYVKLALQTATRKSLHERIETRLERMFQLGFVAEMNTLMQRPDLRKDMPSMRAVGYRQVWSHLAGDYPLEEARYRSLVATRQLAKRQLTWLRSEPGLVSFDPIDGGCLDAMATHLAGAVAK